MNRSTLIGSPSKAMRSRMSCRCGLVKRPVRRPNSRSSRSVIRAVEVLPFVPVMWMTGNVRCGSPISSTTAAIRASVGVRSCSGVRPRISASTWRIRARSLSATIATVSGDRSGVGGGWVASDPPGRVTSQRNRLEGGCAYPAARSTLTRSGRPSPTVVSMTPSPDGRASTDPAEPNCTASVSAITVS